MDDNMRKNVGCYNHTSEPNTLINTHSPLQ